MKTLLPGSICGQGGGVFVTVMLFDAVLLQSPLTTGSGPLSGGVNTSALSMLRPAHAPPTAVGEVRVRRARIPRLVNELFGAVNGDTAPEPLGPATRTLPASSM